MTTSNYERWRNVQIESITRFDKNDWCGIITKEHGEIRCKRRNKSKYKLKKGYKGPLTIFFYGKNRTPTIADDPKGHVEEESHWNIRFPSLFDQMDHGFIYLITNKKTGQRYIGSKTLYTNWKSYTSSSEHVNEAIKEHGKENFDFDILFSCEAKSDMQYAEAKGIMLAGALESDMWYNRWCHQIKFRLAMKDMEKKLETLTTILT